MMVSQTKQRRRKKAKLNTKGFKKVFSFKQQDQQHRLHPHPESPSSPTKPDAAVATTSTHKNKRRRKQPIAADDDDSTVCSATIDKEGVLIFPTVQRLTSSLPPITILDGIHEQQKGDNFFMDLSLGRRRSSRLSSKKNFARSLSSSSRSSALPSYQHRSPYQSKKDQKNLPATLKSCRRSNSKKADTMNDPSSAWKRLDSTTSRSVDPSFTTSFGTSFGCSMVDDMNDDDDDDDDEMCAIGQIDESLLPPEVSPANKFIPIGYEEDGDDVSFASADYDICTQQMSADENDQPEAATVVAVMKKDTAKSEPANQPDNKAACTTEQDNDCIDEYSSPHDVPPSPVSTDGTSIASGCYFGTGGEKDVSPVDARWRMDKYCVALDSQDDNGWFPNVKHEMMKLSALFTSDCSAPSSR